MGRQRRRKDDKDSLPDVAFGSLGPQFCCERSRENKESGDTYYPAPGLLMLPGGGSLTMAQKIPSSLMALTNSWKSTGFTT